MKNNIDVRFDVVDMILHEMYTKHSKMIADYAFKDLVNVKDVAYGDAVVFPTNKINNLSLKESS